MKKTFKNGYTVHVVSHIVGAIVWYLIKGSLTWMPTVLVATIISYIVLFRIMADIDERKLLVSARVILGMNIVLLGLGFILFNFSDTIGSLMLSAGIYFNYGFYALLTMNLPNVLRMTLMILLSPMLLYIGSVINQNK